MFIENNMDHSQWATPWYYPIAQFIFISLHTLVVACLSTLDSQVLCASMLSGWLLKEQEMRVQSSEPLAFWLTICKLLVCLYSCRSDTYSVINCDC